MLAEPIGTPAGTDTLASRYHQRAFAQWSAKEIENWDERELDSTRTGSPLKLLKDVHLMQIPFQTTAKMIVPTKTNKIVFERQRIESQSSKMTLRLQKNTSFLSKSK